MNIMRPNYERDMFYNCYKWHHKTDSMGFRNPTNRESGEVVLLGDSMIYGHGVNETSTVRHHLEELTERSVVNLGIQGNCIHQEYQALKTFGIQLKPEYAFLFFLVNDIQDIAQKNNFNFINVFIYTGGYEEQTYENIISDFCKSNDISFLNLKDYFVPELENGKNLFLKNDGHFTDVRCRINCKNSGGLYKCF